MKLNYILSGLVLTFVIHSSACSAPSSAVNLDTNPQASPTPNVAVWSDGYPDIWWQPVPVADLKSWEISPDSANRSKGEVVLSKRNELGQFSNLAPVGFTMDGIKYASVEGLWQGMKYPENANDERLKNPSIKWPHTREEVYAMTDFEAKDAGDEASAIMKKLGIAWVTYQGQKIEYKGKDTQLHYELILEACRLKVAQNPDLQKLLLSTNDLKFFPDHKQDPKSPPAYFYHEIYMKIRAEIQNP